jgi:iron complex transport system permease protein
MADDLALSTRALTGRAPSVPARDARGALLALALVLVALALHALTVGAMDVPIAHIARAVVAMLSSAGDAENDLIHSVVFDLRLPRVLMTVFAGAALGMTGAALQGLFRNPLADAGLLGITSGAALFTAIAIVGGSRYALGAFAVVLRPAAAFAGALIATLVVARIGQRHGRTVTSTLVLAGVALSSLAAAGVGLLLFLSTDAELRDITFWTLGSMSGATWSTLLMVALPVSAGLVTLVVLSRALDALALGESVAFHLGVPVERTKRALVVVAAFVVGPVVAACGAIGFVGLVVPHVWRLVMGPRHVPLVAGAGLLGAILLLAADSVARTLVAPAELPIGVVTACAGAPFFLYLVSTDAKGGRA